MLWGHLYGGGGEQAHALRGTCVEGELAGIVSFLLPCGFQGQNWSAGSLTLGTSFNFRCVKCPECSWWALWWRYGQISFSLLFWNNVLIVLGRWPPAFCFVGFSVCSYNLGRLPAIVVFPALWVWFLSSSGYSVSWLGQQRQVLSCVLLALHWFCLCARLWRLTVEPCCCGS